jgi:hypothetical protein
VSHVVWCLSKSGLPARFYGGRDACCGRRARLKVCAAWTTPQQRRKTWVALDGCIYGPGRGWAQVRKRAPRRSRRRSGRRWMSTNGGGRRSVACRAGSETTTETRNGDTPPDGSRKRVSSQVSAVAVGFEPTRELPLYTLSRSAPPHPGPSTPVPTSTFALRRTALDGRGRARMRPQLRLGAAAIQRAALTAHSMPRSPTRSESEGIESMGPGCAEAPLDLPRVQGPPPALSPSAGTYPRARSRVGP